MANLSHELDFVGGRLPVAVADGLRNARQRVTRVPGVQPGRHDHVLIGTCSIKRGEGLGKEGKWVKGPEFRMGLTHHRSLAGDSIPLQDRRDTRGT